MFFLEHSLTEVLHMFLGFWHQIRTQSAYSIGPADKRNSKEHRQKTWNPTIKNTHQQRKPAVSIENKIIIPHP